MPLSLSRRTFLFTTGGAVLACAMPALAQTSAETTGPAADLAALERKAGGRLGVASIDIASGEKIEYRAQERFPFCSVFKFVLTGAVLARSQKQPSLLQQKIYYHKADLVAYSPITQTHVADGMSVADLCAAAMQYSDNSAANLLLKLLGGPAAVTAFARSIGNESFRLDRTETSLNTSIPGDVRDTATPASMAASLRALAVDNALSAPAREQMQTWLRGNTVGTQRIRAAVPAGWRVGDRTGTGEYGATNDVAVIWRPGMAPLLLAIFYTQDQPDAGHKEDVLADATRIVLSALA